MQADNKPIAEHGDIEKAHTQGHEYETEELKVLGEERVELTEEDVRSYRLGA